MHTLEVSPVVAALVDVVLDDEIQDGCHRLRAGVANAEWIQWNQWMMLNVAEPTQTRWMREKLRSGSERPGQ